MNNNNPNGYYDPQTGAFVPFAAPKKKKSLTWLYILIVAALALMITKCAADYAKENGYADEPAETEAEAAETVEASAVPDEPEAEPEPEPEPEPEQEPEPEPEYVKSGTYTVAGVTMHYSRTVPNDVTGRWRIATCTSATVPETIIPEIFEAFRPEKNEVFWIVNYGLKTTTRLNYFGGDIVYYSTLEYVEDEENDAKVLGGGMEYSFGQIDLTEQKP